MKNVYTSSEAPEYLNISTQRLNQLVHNKKIEPIKTSKPIMLFFKDDLDKCKIANASNMSTENQVGYFDINIPYVRDAILYYTIQQYFNNNDKKTCVFIEQLEQFKSFNFRSGLKTNILLLSSQLNITEKEFYSYYIKVKESFSKLTDDVILVKNEMEFILKRQCSFIRRKVCMCCL
jgi:DNA processing protein